MAKKRIAVALSGGVDSSVAALLLRKDGYEVIGLHMVLWGEDNAGSQYLHGQPDFRGTTEKIVKLCSQLGICHHILDVREEFKKQVIDFFCMEYMRGKTPNPCIKCNKYLKFGFLLEKALSLDADYLSTGHYAKVIFNQSLFRLFKGVDSTKDQSYMLFSLNQKQLRHIILPLGEYSKYEVQKIAMENNLLTAAERSSQDICFIRGNYGEFIYRHYDPVAGDIINKAGIVLGQHDGIALYTIGQRHGLGIAATSRLYVTGIDYDKNRIIVGPEEELYSKELTAVNVSWISGMSPNSEIEISAKIRYKSSEAAAVLYSNSDTAKIVFKQAQRAITPGQAVVFYQGNEILGGGTIENQS